MPRLAPCLPLLLSLLASAGGPGWAGGRALAAAAAAVLAALLAPSECEAAQQQQVGRWMRGFGVVWWTRTGGGVKIAAAGAMAGSQGHRTYLPVRVYYTQTVCVRVSAFDTGG